MLDLQLHVLGFKLLVPRENVDDVGELVGVLVFDLIEEVLVLLHGLDLALNHLGLPLVSLVGFLEPLDINLVLDYLLHFIISDFLVSILPDILLL